MIEHLDITISEFDKVLVDRNHLLDAIGGVGALATHDAAVRLTQYLVLINSYTEKGKAYDDQVAFTVIQNLGIPRRQGRVLRPISTQYLTYTAAVKKAARAALDKLKREGAGRPGGHPDDPQARHSCARRLPPAPRLLPHAAVDGPALAVAAPRRVPAGSRRHRFAGAPSPALHRVGLFALCACAGLSLGAVSSARMADAALAAFLPAPAADISEFSWVLSQDSSLSQNGAPLHAAAFARRGVRSSARGTVLVFLGGSPPG